MPRAGSAAPLEADNLEETQPSPVIHFKNVPKFTSKHDIVKITSQFGPHKILVILRPKEQALIEMENLDDAIALFNHAMETPIIVHNYKLRVGYSIHKNLQSNPHDYTPSHIILITICGSAKSPLSLPELAKMCNKSHNVVKILMFHHDAGPQALVQFQTKEEAKAVKESLEKEELIIDDKLITFEIQYSKFPDLRVNQNTKYTWDFTVAPLPEPESPQSSESAKSPEPEKSRSLLYPTAKTPDVARPSAPVEAPDSLQQLLNTPSLKPYRMPSQQPPAESLLSSHRWSSNSLQEYNTNNYVGSGRSQYSTLSDSFNSSGRSRAFSFNGRNSGGPAPLTSPDLRVGLDGPRPEPLTTAYGYGGYRGYRGLMNDYEIPMIPNAFHYSSSPRPSDLVYDIYSCSVTFFTLYYSTHHVSFIKYLHDYASVADYVVHRGNDSIIVAVAYFSHYDCKELALRICNRENIRNDMIEVVNTVDYDSFHRIRDYVLYRSIKKMMFRPELLDVPISTNLVNLMMEGQVNVFPVAICYSNFPPSFDRNDVCSFVMKYGTVELCTEMDRFSSSPLASQGEEIAEQEGSYRVQYTERYNILLILQNRSKLIVNGYPIHVEPLF